MKEYLEIPLTKLSGISYSNVNHSPDELEYFLMEEISKQTGFFIARIHIKKAEKLKYSRKFNYFEFEYDNKNYILEKGIIKEVTN